MYSKKENNVKDHFDCILDNKLQVIRSDENFSSLLGYTKDSIVGKKVIYGEEISHALLEPGFYEGSAVLLCANGVTCYAYVRIENSENRYKLKSLRIVEYADNELLETLFRTSPVPTMILSKDHRIVDLNNEMVNLTGIHRNQLIGKKCFTVMHETDEAVLGCPLDNALKTGHGNGVNIMDTVFGRYLISIMRINDDLYAHYAIKEAAVLLDVNNKMINLLDRYNRILLVTTSVNDAILQKNNVFELIEQVKDKVIKMGLFQGMSIYLFTDKHVQTLLNQGDVIDIDKLRNLLKSKTQEKNVITISMENGNHTIFKTKTFESQVIVIVNTGSDKLSSDEVDVIQSTINRVGEYVELQKLEDKRERAYSYITDTMKDFAILVDRIRNPLATIMATAEVEIEDDELREKIMKNVSKIEDITKKIDKIWNEAESMHRFLDER